METIIIATLSFVAVAIWAIGDLRRQVKSNEVFIVEYDGKTVGEFDNMGDAVDYCSEYNSQYDVQCTIVIKRV